MPHGSLPPGSVETPDKTGLQDYNGRKGRKEVEEEKCGEGYCEREVTLGHVCLMGSGQTGAEWSNAIILE